MKLSTTAALLTTALSLAAVPTVPATAHAPAERGGPKVTVNVPDSLVEGDRFAIEVKVRRTKRATRILLQRFTTDVLGNTSWATVKRAKVAGKRNHSFGAVAGADDVERYRARVLYEDRKPAISKPASSTVWHWTSLLAFDDYYQSPGVYANSIFSFAINGRTYRGVFASSGGPSWEIRFTPGRHCRGMRGDLGVTDESADGSSGVISLVADETTPVLTSATLTPGMSQPFLVDLATPYRLSVQMQKTSPADQTVYPAIGNPELLCTGLG